MSRRKTKTQKEVSKIVDKKVPLALDANVLYNEFIGLTNIERAGAEDFVLTELMRGKAKNEIIAKLTARYSKSHPHLKFNYPDLEKFMARNQAIVRAMAKEVSLSAERHLRAREQVEEMLAGLAMYTQSLVKDLRNEADNTNAIAAIRALNTTLDSYMKLKGFTKSNEGVQVANIIQLASEGKSSLRDKVNKANFVDAKIKEKKD